MKKVLALFVVLLFIASCSKQSINEDPSDKWNGYFHYLKTGEVHYKIMAGKNTHVGWVTYGIDDNANFYATYNCDTSGWTMSETHMFAGDKLSMPLNKPGNPKIGLFPYAAMHNPRVSNFTYTVPLTTLPPYAEPGFTVAAHCVVHSPTGRVETGWAKTNFPFTDKGWGWYDTYYYNQPENPFTILYGISTSGDSLNVYHLDVTNGESELILQEYVGNTGGSYDAAAYDPESGNLFFVKLETDELWYNNLPDTNFNSVWSGPVIGDVTSATFDNDTLYYIDAITNTIHGITFDTDWHVVDNTVLGTIPATIDVNDIALNPAGDYLYMIAQVENEGTQLIIWQVSNDTYYSIDLLINDIEQDLTNPQLAYGSDGALYITANDPDGSGSVAYLVDTNTGVIDEIVGDGIGEEEDPLSDITKGPIL